MHTWPFRKRRRRRKWWRFTCVGGYFAGLAAAGCVSGRGLLRRE